MHKGSRARLKERNKMIHMLDIPAKDDPFYVLYPLLGHCFVDEPDNLMIFFMQKKQFIDIG